MSQELDRQSYTDSRRTLLEQWEKEVAEAIDDIRKDVPSAVQEALMALPRRHLVSGLPGGFAEGRFEAQVHEAQRELARELERAHLAKRAIDAGFRPEEEELDQERLRALLPDVEGGDTVTLDDMECERLTTQTGSARAIGIGALLAKTVLTPLARAHHDPVDSTLFLAHAARQMLERKVRVNIIAAGVDGMEVRLNVEESHPPSREVDILVPRRFEAWFAALFEPRIRDRMTRAIASGGPWRLSDLPLLKGSMYIPAVLSGDNRFYHVLDPGLRARALKTSILPQNEEALWLLEPQRLPVEPLKRTVVQKMLQRVRGLLNFS